MSQLLSNSIGYLLDQIQFKFSDYNDERITMDFKKEMISNSYILQLYFAYKGEFTSIQQLKVDPENFSYLANELKTTIAKLLNKPIKSTFVTTDKNEEADLIRLTFDLCHMINTQVLPITMLFSKLKQLEENTSIYSCGTVNSTDIVVQLFDHETDTILIELNNPYIRQRDIFDLIIERLNTKLFDDLLLNTSDSFNERYFRIREEIYETKAKYYDKIKEEYIEKLVN